MEAADLIIEGDRIVEVRSAKGVPDVDHGNAVILPAFVNAHSHLEYTLFRNAVEVWPFVPWLERVTTMKRMATEKEMAASALLGAVENSRAGVGLIGEYSDSPVSARAIRDAGLRGVVFQEFIAVLEPEDQYERVQEFAQLQRTEGGEAVDVYVAPHATYTVPPEMLDRFRSGRTAIHCAESIEEERFLLDGTGDFAEAFRRFGLPVKPVGLRPAPLLQRVGLLRQDVQLVHCVHLNQEDIAAIAASGACIAHCPKSNMKLSSGAAPLWEMLEAAIPVGLGTDSLMSNNRADMFEEMRQASFINNGRGKPPISADTLLRLATLEGARTLGKEAEWGSLEPGKGAHFAIVSLEGPNFKPINFIETALVYCACAADVRATFVSGEPVHTPTDYPGTIKMVTSASERITAALAG